MLVEKPQVVATRVSLNRLRLCPREILSNQDVEDVEGLEEIPKDASMESVIELEPPEEQPLEEESSTISNQPDTTNAQASEQESDDVSGVWGGGRLHARKGRYSSGLCS